MLIISMAHRLASSTPSRRATAAPPRASSEPRRNATSGGIGTWGVEPRSCRLLTAPRRDRTAGEDQPQLHRGHDRQDVDLVPEPGVPDAEHATRERTDSQVGCGPALGRQHLLESG